MEDRLSEEQPTETFTFSKVFREAFPHYLVMGMSAEEFWDGEPWLAKAYRKAYQIRIENENRIADRDAWRIGQYIRYAIVSTPAVVNGFVPKGHQMQEYPEKPMTVTAEEQKQEEVRKKQEDNKQAMAQAMFHAFAEKMNKNIRRRLEREAKKD